MALHSMKEINAALGVELAPKDIIGLGFPPDQLEKKRTFWNTENVAAAAGVLAQKAVELARMCQVGTLSPAVSTPPVSRKPRDKAAAAAAPLPPGVTDFEDSEF